MLKQELLDGANSRFVDVVTQARAHGIRFLLWPTMWKQCQLPISLNWSIFEFGQHAVNTIPQEPGVYAFLIQPRVACNLDASYLSYIGRTDRSLRQRYCEYLRELDEPTGRPLIIDTLIRYSGYIYFSCAIIVDPNITTQQVENELLKALAPPSNSRLPSEVQRVVDAF